MNIKVDWSQPSTWRGAVMLASGVIVGGLTLLGYTEQATQANNLLNTIIGLISGAMVGSGTIGVLTKDLQE